LASLPVEGSVKAKAAIFLPVAKSGKYFSFCAGVPNNNIPLNPIL